MGGLVGQGQAGITVLESSNGATVSGKGQYIEGIVGVLTGTIDKCYNQGTVKTNGNFNNTGGIIGINVFNATVTNCYNKGTINGYVAVGGIAGTTHEGAGCYLKITNCYNIGSVRGSRNVSEMIGYFSSSKGLVTNSYTKSQGPTATKLGNAFVNDTTNINGGYPVLKWQVEE